MPEPDGVEEEAALEDVACIDGLAGVESEVSCAVDTVVSGVPELDTDAAVELAVSPTVNTSPRYVAVAIRLGLAAEKVYWLMVQHVRFVRS